MREKVVLIGAGSAMFTRGLLRDLIHREWDADVALVDVDAHAAGDGRRTGAQDDRSPAMRRCGLSSSHRPARRAAERHRGDRHDRRRRAPRVEQDVFVPRKHGIFQPVGDTVMPGGTSRALRMIPPMIEIAEDVLDLAPEALFFNYGNPMAAVCRGGPQGDRGERGGALPRRVPGRRRTWPGRLGVPSGLA